MIIESSRELIKCANDAKHRQIIANHQYLQATQQETANIMLPAEWVAHWD